MSRIRTVGGNITKTGNGVTTIEVRGGDFRATAGNENNWNGKGGGITHHPYTAPHLDDKLNNRLDLTLNLFFDGTTNNRTNTDAREKNNKTYEENSNKKDDSYENDYTNVARAYDAISLIDPVSIKKTKQVRVYIEGVGTTDEKSDDMLPVGIAQSAGFWSTGIKDKVRKGCEKGAIEIKEAAKGKPIDSLTINVFGFSRGAASARHFLSVTDSASYTVKVSANGQFLLPGAMMPLQYPINTKDKTKPLYPENFEVKFGLFGRYLAEQGVFEIGEVIFNFVGLYDTVSSHGFNHNNDVKDLGLKAIKKAKMIFQISAADEYRENFDLTNIDSAGFKGLELTFPGVHSDIGGSYLAHDEERSAVHKESYYFGTRDEDYNFIPNTEEANAFKKILVNEGWYNDQELKLEYNKDKKIAYLVGIRTLENTYDKIALNKMIMVSEQFKVVYNDTIKKQKNNILDPFIADVFTQLTNYSKAVMTHRNKSLKGGGTVVQYITESKQISYLDYINSEDLKKLRHKYLHWSVKADEFGLEPRFTEILPIEKRKREIHNG